MAKSTFRTVQYSIQNRTGPKTTLDLSRMDRIEWFGSVYDLHIFLVSVFSLVWIRTGWSENRFKFLFIFLIMAMICKTACDLVMILLGLITSNKFWWAFMCSPNNNRSHRAIVAHEPVVGNFWDSACSRSDPGLVRLRPIRSRSRPVTNPSGLRSFI